MSILVEIAEQANVPVEGVIRVLTREPVSDAVSERVLAVLDDLTPEQTRAVQRFALAALHDVLPRPAGGESREPPPEVNENQLTLPEPPPEPPAAAPDTALVELSSVLRELAEAVRDLRRETDAERRERVDDLAVLIDLITTGWQGLDARLGRIEKQVARIDANRRSQDGSVPALAAARPPIELVGRPEPPAADVADRRWHDRVPLAAALTLAGAVIGTFAVLQLTSNGPNVAALVSARDEPVETSVGSSSTTGGASSGTAPAPATTAPKPATTAPTTPRTAKPPASPRTRTTATTPAPPPPPSFKPTRNWAWAPVSDADYYSVVFTRGGKAFYAASPTEPRLTLPAALVFRPGAYRWVVRAGYGAKAANRLGPPVVNSRFDVS